MQKQKFSLTVEKNTLLYAGILSILLSITSFTQIIGKGPIEAVLLLICGAIFIILYFRIKKNIEEGSNIYEHLKIINDYASKKFLTLVPNSQISKGSTNSTTVPARPNKFNNSDDRLNELMNKSIDVLDESFKAVSDLMQQDHKTTHLYKSILHATKNAMFATDLDTKITFINPKALALLGKTEKEVLGKKCCDVFNVELCKTEQCAIECYKNGRKSCSFMFGNKELSTEAFGLKNEKGSNIGYIEIITDTTEETVLKKEIQAKIKWYEGMLNYIPVPISVTDNNKKITFLNKLALDILGKTEAETAGKHCGDVWGVPICKDERCGIEYLKCGKGISTFEIGNSTMTTDARYLVDENGNNVGHIEIVGDISDTVARENYNQKAVEKLAAGIEKMASGDLTDIDFTMEPASQNTQIAYSSFSAVAEHLYTLKEHLVTLISQLQQAIHTTSAASAEIATTADSLATATQEQSAQTDEVASAMEEMSKTVTNNANSATQTADVAKRTVEVATSGGKVVDQTVTKMKEIALVVKTSAENIVKLGESSKKIGEIISVIDDIADQTNLLSLNAAIEAARAGEQGRGFAVVADSVGKLAVSTASATKEIANMIKGIQLDTETAVKAMEKGTVEVQSGIELADNAGHSIKDILHSIGELLDMVNQIAAASEQQSATSEEISKNVSSISKVTAESAQNVETVAITANDLTRMTDTLNSLASQFKVNTDYHSSHAIASNNKYLG